MVALRGTQFNVGKQDTAVTHARCTSALQDRHRERPPHRENDPLTNGLFAVYSQQLMDHDPIYARKGAVHYITLQFF